MANATQVWACEQPDVHLRAEYSNTPGIDVSRSTSPTPPNGGTHTTVLGSGNVGTHEVDLADPTTFGTVGGSTFNRITFKIRWNNIEGIILATSPFVDFYQNIDATSGARNFKCRARAEVVPGGNTKLYLIDSTGATLATFNAPFVDDTDYKADVLYQISATVGAVIFYIDGAAVAVGTGANTKAGSDTKCIHRFEGQENVLDVQPDTDTYIFPGIIHDTEVLNVPRADYGVRRFRPRYEGVTPPAKCNDVDVESTPGDDLDSGIMEYFSDDTANKCGYDPASAGAVAGGAAPCDRISDKGPMSGLGANANIIAEKLVWWYDIIVRFSVATDPWLTYGKLNGTTYTMHAVNVAIGINKLHSVTLFVGDTFFADPDSDFAVGGLFHKAVSTNPRNFQLEQWWCFYFFDWPDPLTTVKVLGGNILGGNIAP